MASFKVLCQFWLERLNKRFYAKPSEIQKIRFFKYKVGVVCTQQYSVYLFVVIL